MGSITCIVGHTSKLQKESAVVGSARSVRLVRIAAFLVMKTGTCFVMSVMAPIMLIASVHKWQAFLKMVGNAKDAGDVRIVTVKHQGPDRAVGGMQTTLSVTLATSKETKALPALAVEELTDILPKGR